MTRIAIVQSNYIPWRGYFDLMASVDTFVLYDDVQFTRRDWRNRNRIKTPNGTQWLTVPVITKGLYKQTIRETRIDGAAWAQTHWRSLEANYAKAAHFREVASRVAPIYDRSYDTLSQLNTAFLATICEYMNIATTLSDSATFQLADEKSERLASICEQAGADVYVSGPAAQAYLDEAPFSARGIRVEWFDYSGYVPYPQLWGTFEPAVTVLDLMFNCGPRAADHLRHGAR